MRFKDKVAIVTGSTSGIGRATARQLVEEGGRVLTTGLDPAASAELLAELEAPAATSGGGALFVPADLSDATTPKRLVDAAVAQWGRVDILVNNAAAMTFDHVESMDVTAWDRLFAVNLRAPFLLVQAALPHMGTGATIVNVSSVHAEETMAGVVPYAASKGGLEAFTRGLAVELRARGIRVSAVRLGAIDTPLLWNNPNVKSGKEKIDRAAVGTPRQAAQAILFLASADSSFSTGAILNVDGGRLADL
ncbi:MAG: SDR family NAD(P)-dependent oxidoreductase [Pseudomonadota bacterium]